MSGESEIAIVSSYVRTHFHRVSLIVSSAFFCVVGRVSTKKGSGIGIGNCESIILYERILSSHGMDMLGRSNWSKISKSMEGVDFVVVSDVLTVIQNDQHRQWTMHGRSTSSQPTSISIGIEYTNARIVTTVPRQLSKDELHQQVSYGAFFFLL